MLALMLAAFLSGPLVTPDCSRHCLGVCYWDARAGYCQDSRVERLGTWDPRPAPEDWPSNAYLSAPYAWGSYPTEKPAEAPQASYQPEW